MARTITERNRLVEEYLRVAEVQAAKAYAKYWKYYTRDEILSHAHLGLIGAGVNYDDTSGVPFFAYAAVRVRGAIVDGIREHSKTPRGARRTSRELTDAEEKFREQNGTTATVEELAEELDIRVVDVYKRRHARALLDMTSLSLTTGEKEQPIAALVAAPEIPELHDGFWAEALRGLTKFEKWLVTSYYIEGKSGRELSEECDLSEGTVQQRRRHILQKIESLPKRDLESLLH